MSELYDPFEPGRSRARARAKALLARYNRSADDERNYRASILRELLGRIGPGATVEPPFFRANRKLWSAVRIFPTWSRPVGDGAMRVTMFPLGLIAASSPAGRCERNC